MNLPVDQTLGTLRALDPAADLSTSTDAVEAALRGVLDTSDDVIVMSDCTPRRSRRVAIAMVAACVLAVAGVAIGIAATRPDGTAPHSVPAIDTSPPSPSANLKYLDHAQAKQFVDERFDNLQAPAGAHVVDRAPVPSLAQQSWGIAPGYLYERTLYWTVSMSVREMSDYLIAHPPVGSKLSGHGGAEDYSSQEVDFTSSAYPTVDYFMMIVPKGTGSAIRVDVATLWHPAKPAIEVLGKVDKVAVNLSVARPSTNSLGGPILYAKWFYGADAQKLAAAVDALPVTGPDNISCPGPMPGDQYTLTFYSLGRVTKVTGVTGNGCAAGPAVTVNGASQPSLLGQLDPLVRQMLKVPPLR